MRRDPDLTETQPEIPVPMAELVAAYEWLRQERRPIGYARAFCSYCWLPSRQCECATEGGR